MTLSATGLKRIKNPKPLNFVGMFLKLQIDDYVQADRAVSRSGIQRDLSKVLGCTPDAIDNWYEGRNGVKHLMAEKLAFLFDASLDQITDNGRYTPPATPPAFDKPAFAKHVLAVTNLSAISKENLNCEDLRRDLRETATEYLRSVGKLRDSLKPATAPIGNRMPSLEQPESAPVGPMASCDARPATKPEPTPPPYTPGERQAVPELPEPVAQVMASDEERNQIQMFLHQAEKFRQNNNLEWFLDGNRLRARRVITEEF